MPIRVLPDHDVRDDTLHEKPAGETPDPDYATDNKLDSEKHPSIREDTLASPLPGRTSPTTGAEETTLSGHDHDLEPGLQEVQAILQPLPPGWAQGQRFSRGLHPSTDVFDLQDEASQQHTCEKREGNAPRPVLGESSPCDNGVDAGPDLFSPSSTPEEPAAGQDDGGDQGNPSQSSVPEPRGEPSSLSAQQGARLHELLRAGDLAGKLPRGLDRHASDDEIWHAYRQEMKDSYRAERKRKRAERTRRKDDNRGWNPAMLSNKRTSGPRQQDDRPPLPRRRAPPREE